MKSLIILFALISIAYASHDASVVDPEPVVSLRRSIPDLAPLKSEAMANVNRVVKSAGGGDAQKCAEMAEKKLDEMIQQSSSALEKIYADAQSNAALFERVGNMCIENFD